MRRLLSILLLTFAAPLTLLAGDGETPAAPAPSPRGGPNAGFTQLFQITLLRAAISGSEELVGVPKNAEKAIRDVRDFLPFKSYKLLDSTLIRAEKGSKASTRLDGVPPQQYDVRLVYTSSASSGKLSILSFFEVFAVRPPGGTPLPSGVAPQAERPVISTSFSVDVGETIVVGSSKLGGDEALIVLLTALPNT